MAVFPERTATSMRHAYVLLIEGCPFGFTDEYELADDHGLFGSSWYKDDGFAQDDRSIKLGLSVPKSLKIALDLETGIIEEDQAVFNILDIDGTVPEFFGGELKAYKLLGERLPPTSNPAPLVVDINGNNLNLDSTYVGIEAIGPSGQRNWYSACPTWENNGNNLPGHDHPSKDEPLPVVTANSIGPYLVEGRRVALYRIIYGETLSPPRWYTYYEIVTNAIDNNYSPALWWGTLRQAGKVDGRSWSINCVGPGSWLRKSLNNRTTTKWYTVTSDFELSAPEKHIGVIFNKRAWNNGSYLLCGNTYSLYTVDDTSIATVVNSIDNAIQATVVAMGADAEYDSNPGGEGSVEFTESHIKISLPEESPGLFYQGNMKLILSRPVWRMLGYDPDANVGNNDGPGPHFSPAPGFAFLNANPDIAVANPIPVYYTALITTCPEGEDPLNVPGEPEWAGTGTRVFYPTYPAGVSLLSGNGDQLVHVEPIDGEEIYVETQTIRPHYNAGEIDGTPVNCQRLWAFRGKIQLPKKPTESEQPEPVDTVQVARCLWVEFDSGIMAKDETGYDRGLYISEWLDPRLFGFHHEPIDPALGWASNNGGEQIECSPLAHFGVFYKKMDDIYPNLTRILTSTGTAIWTPGTEEPPGHPNPYASDDEIFNILADVTPGENNDAINWPGGDYEIYDMGLQISRYMVDFVNISNASKDLDPSLRQSKIAIQGGPIQSEDLFEAILAPRGWVFSLKRGKYGVYAPYKSPELKYEEGLDFEITESDLWGIAGEPDSVIPTVELRPVYPFDRLVFSHTGNPTEDWISGQEDLKYKARDLGARARSGTREKKINAPDLPATSWFAEGDQDNPNKAPNPLAWTGVISDLWEKEIPKFLAKPHRKIEGLKISRPKGQDIYPGAIIKLTNPWPANSNGSYGFSQNYCRVISVEHETDSCACIIDCIAYADATVQKWAPILKVIDDAATPDDRYNATTRTFYCEKYLNHDGIFQQSVLNFIKPVGFAVVDAPAHILILQYDGVNWVNQASGYVNSVNAGLNTLTLTAGGLTGTFYERMYSIIVMAPASNVNQVAWVKQLFAQHTSALNADSYGIKPLIP